MHHCSEHTATLGQVSPHVTFFHDVHRASVSGDLRQYRNSGMAIYLRKCETKGAALVLIEGLWCFLRTVRST